MFQKIQKVTGGLTRLASRTKVRKEESVRVRLRLHQNTVAQWTEQHIVLVRELATAKRLQYIQTNQHTQRYVYQVRMSIEKKKEINNYINNMLCRNGYKLKLN